MFYNQGKVFEIFARTVAHGNLFGFLEVEELVFGERSTLLVDPAEDSLKKEFENVRRIYIPLHSVIRIDELEKSADLRPRVVSMNGGASRSPDESRITPIYTPPNPFTGR